MIEYADIVVVGGGFTGSALACALADGRRRVLVFEARESQTQRFAGELIHPARLDVLDRGVLLRLRKIGSDIAGFAVIPGRARSATLLRYAAMPGGSAPGLGIEHSLLVSELGRSAAARPGVEVRRGLRAEVLRDAHGRVVGVTTDDGNRVYAQLVLGAEGRHSKLRAQLGMPTQKRLVSFTAALLVAHGELPHPGFGHVILGGPGPILAYPIGARGVRMCFDLPTASERRPEDLPAMIRRDYAQFVPAPLHAPMLHSSIETSRE